jgi:NAD(P)-dependent dehydrogenase (short-subunit alcohol dehydrogenase family)
LAKFAVITGGAQGIGAAIAKRFLTDDYNGVLLVDRNADGLATQAQALTSLGHVEVLAADLLDGNTPSRVISAAIKAFGHIDVLVNAAGNTERGGIGDTTVEAYERLFGVNVRAPLFLMQEAAKVMRPRQSGIIINVASMIAYGGPPNLAVYSASKAALMMLTKHAANTWKREGIRAFCINLGWALTDGEHALQTGFHSMPQDWADQIGKRMPAGRLITSDDVAGLAAFLVSAPAQMMNGAVIDYEQMPTGVFDAHPALLSEL